jgi:probable O-glycosylation ligase (exosortase A-associated)
MKGLLFTYLLTYGGAFRSLFNPYQGVLIYICFAIIKPEYLWSYSVPQGGQYSRIVAIALLLGWAWKGFGNWNLGRASAITTCLVCFLIWSAVGAQFAVADATLAREQVEEYAKIVLPFLVGITTLRTRRELEQLAWVIAVSQGYLAYEFNREYYSVPYFNANEWQFAGLDRNGISITMVASAGFTFFLGLYATRWWQKALALAMFGLSVHVVLFSLSRGGMLALILTGVVIAVLIPKQPKYVLVGLLALAIGWRLAGSSVLERFETVFLNKNARDDSAQSRLELWGACFRVMSANPVFGIGSQNWRLVAHHYGFAKGKDAHSTWFHVGAELGVTGLCVLVCFYGLCVGRLWRLTRHPPPSLDPWLLHASHMVVCSILGFVLAAQFVSVFAVELPYYLVLVGAGVLKLASVDSATALPDRTDCPSEGLEFPNSPAGATV